MQCRITTEDPENHFIPDYGRISAYREATGFGIRLDGGTAYSSAVITPFYDSLLEKVTAWAPTHEESTRRMDRALREFRIRGVTTNLAFLEALIAHPQFRSGDYTTRFIDETPELFRFRPRRDRATRLLAFIGEVIVNGNPEVAGRAEPDHLPVPVIPEVSAQPSEPYGTRDRLLELGPEGFARWMRDERRLLVTDTTFRDAHQSLLATRFRTHDLVAPAAYYARNLAGLFSLEAWGGATFDVAMRFLREDPWDRLSQLRAAAPNILIQMLLRSSNAVGYTNYPDNVVRYFVQQAAEGGIDLFRVFDSLNWVENMRVAMDAVLESGALLEASICYTGDLTDPARSKYDLGYYVRMAKELEAAGAHILGIKDMAGLCKPEAARHAGARRCATRSGIPIHFHTHDTSGISAASVLAAAEAGVDAVDLAMDPMSGLTSQPNLGGVVEALRGTPRDTGHRARVAGPRRGLLGGRPRRLRRLRERPARGGVGGLRARDARRPVHQPAPAGARARHRGALARGGPHLRRREQDVRRHREGHPDVEGGRRPRGLHGHQRPHRRAGARPRSRDRVPRLGGRVLPRRPRPALRRLPGGAPGQGPQGRGRRSTVRPGEVLEPIDLDAARAEAEKKVRRHVSDRELASYLMYPKVFAEFAEHQRLHGDVSVLPTPVFFYGLRRDDELFVDIERGKTLVIRFLAAGEADDEGKRTIFFELNGQPREVKVVDRVARADRARPAHGRRGRPEPRGGPDARSGGGGVGPPGGAGRARRPAALDRGDEDGDRRLRRARRRRARGAGVGRHAG